MKKLIVGTMCLCASGFSSFAWADDAEVLNLDTVTVSANRVDKTLQETSSKVSVITDEEIDRYLQRNIKDLVKYEPGVTVAGQGRYGLSGFNIRGIDGDRVQTLIDGTPIADEFTFGPNLSARRNFVDIDSLKAVEIVRGPVSNLYGSNAIGGLVTFVTKDPMDYLNQGKKSQYLGARVGYDQVDSSFDGSITYAGGNSRWQAMILGTYRKGHEHETYFSDDNTVGSARKAANPMDVEDNNILAKLVFSPNNNHQFKLTMDYFKSDSQTEVLNQVGTSVYGTVKNAVNADDSRERKRISFQYKGTVETPFFDEFDANLYSQDSETKQNTFEARTTPSQVQQSRTRNSYFGQENKGFKLTFFKDVNEMVEWVYGFDYDVTDSDTLREGHTVVTATGVPVREYSNFPTRDFPNSEYKSYGVFIQNDLSFFNDVLVITPGIRYDKFSLDPTADAIYLSGNTGSPTPASYSEAQVSMKLGAVVNLSDRWSLFGQYAEGFKAPPIDAVNTGFTNFAGGYTALPNPDLKPESSESVEFGFRYKGEQHHFEMSVYNNDYNNFIYPLAYLGVNPATGFREFQAINLDKTEIRGIELRGYWRLDAVLEGLKLQYAYAYSKGRDSVAKVPLNSIQPETATLGLGYDSAGGKWGSELVLVGTKRKTKINPSGLTANQVAFQTPGYGVLDWVGYYNISKNMKVNWGVFNLTDKKYWQWNSILLSPENASYLSRYTQPGRNASVSFSVNF